MTKPLWNSLFAQLAPESGYTETALPGLRLYRGTGYSPQETAPYRASLCFVLQGRKMGHIGSHQFEYNPHTYLVISAETPLEMEIFASPEKPLLGASLDLDIPKIYSMIRIIDQQDPVEDETGPLPHLVEASRLTAEMTEALKRLLTALTQPGKGEILGPGLVDEIYYHALTGDQGRVLRELCRRQSSYAQVIGVINQLQHRYAEKLKIEDMAKAAHMSPSAFHRAFKEVTAESPLQYLKTLRLNRAKDFITSKGLRSYEAAAAVGYESPSQFSREFKRYFGVTTRELTL